MEQAVAATAPLEWIGLRYKLVHTLGSGGMGVVYCARDRLTGQVVALKRVQLQGARLRFSGASTNVGFEETLAHASTPSDQPRTSGPSDPSTREATAGFDIVASNAIRLALAQEFRTLAALRHPYIISVLDYGFADGQPFFTMELLENAAPLAQAFPQLPPRERAELLLQVLSALTYLHRHRVLHRDLKPANVLVTAATSQLKRPQAKLLDFGLAVARSSRPSFAREVVGTLPYMAPELFLGEAPSPASDLYAFGVMLYELYVGQLPFDSVEPGPLIDRILRGRIDLLAEGLSPRLSELLGRLLQRDPRQRLDDARLVRRSLAAALGLDDPREELAVRESFLQAAEFVGRETELALLRQALASAAGDQGGLWLVGAESGAGKSRLLEELRTHALVDGVRVVRGQVARDGGPTDKALAEVLRPLCLHTELSPSEASVLKVLLPDLPSLLERPVADAPPLDPVAHQQRLLSVVEALLLRQSQWTLLILEDLHWAAPGLLQLLRRLTPQLATRPLLILGSYRDDEMADLPQRLPGCRPLKLNRMDRQEISALAESMLGQIGRGSQLVSLLLRETEGNALFVVEVVRSLASAAGSLDSVGTGALPTQVTPGGVRSLLARRLQQVPAEDQRLLKLAAIAGRELDLAALRKACPELDRALLHAAAAAVLEVVEDRWRFSHDKLRETLLADLPAAEQRALHRQVGEAIEAAHTDVTEHAARLFHHFEHGGDRGRAARYGVLAGERALSRGSVDEAERLLRASVKNLAQLDAPRLEQARAQRLLAEAVLSLGRVHECCDHCREGLAVLGMPLPRSPLGHGLNVLAEGARLAFAHGTATTNAELSAERQAIELERLRLLRIFGENSVWTASPSALAHSALLMLNSGNRLGKVVYQVMGLSGLGYMTHLTPLHALAMPLLDESVRRADRAGDPSARLDALRIRTTVLIAQGHFDRALADVTEAERLARQLGDELQLGFCLRMHRIIPLLTADYAEMTRLSDELKPVAARQQSAVDRLWGPLVQTSAELARGRFVEAESSLAGCQELLDRTEDRVALAYAAGIKALYAQRCQPALQALQALIVGVPIIVATPMKVSGVLEGAKYSAEAASRLAAQHPELRPQVLPLLHKLATFLRRGATQTVVVGARARLTQGYIELSSDRTAAALPLFREALAIARSIRLPLDEALAHEALAVALQSVIHLEAARAIYVRLGADGYLTQLTLNPPSLGSPATEPAAVPRSGETRG